MKVQLLVADDQNSFSDPSENVKSCKMGRVGNPFLHVICITNIDVVVMHMSGFCLKISYAQIVKTSVSNRNSTFHDLTHLDDCISKRIISLVAKVE